jgi:hypothetical protein
MSSMNPSDLLIRFRLLPPAQQTAIGGLILFIVYMSYATFVMGLKPLDAVNESIYNSIIFMVVFYFVTVIITRKKAQNEMPARGPKKGLRGK